MIAALVWRRQVSLRYRTGSLVAALALALLALCLAAPEGSLALSASSDPGWVVAALAPAATPAQSAPTSCYDGDSLCTYCMNHTAALACTTFAQVGGPPHQSEPDTAPPTAAPVTHPGAAIIQGIYISAVVAAESRRVSGSGVSWSWCGGWSRRAANSPPSC
jgi:hypothetical protein